MLRKMLYCSHPNHSVYVVTLWRMVEQVSQAAVGYFLKKMWLVTSRTTLPLSETFKSYYLQKLVVLSNSTPVMWEHILRQITFKQIYTAISLASSSNVYDINISFSFAFIFTIWTHHPYITLTGECKYIQLFKEVVKSSIGIVFPSLVHNLHG